MTEGRIEIPAEAIEALALELAAETGERSIVDGAGTYEAAKLARARRLLEAAYPYLLAAFSKQVEAMVKGRELNSQDCGWVIPTTDLEYVLERLADTSQGASK